MRITTLLVLLALVSGAQLTHAQSQSGVDIQPAPAVNQSRPETYPRPAYQEQTPPEQANGVPASPAGVQPLNPNPPVAVEAQPAGEQAPPPDTLPDANQKSPYWEPRDQSYIYNQGP